MSFQVMVMLKYDTAKPWDDPGRRARWQVWSVSPETRLLGKLLDDDASVERALWVADLLGCREEAIKAMREEADALKAAARHRVERAQEEQVKAQVEAVAERREAQQLLHSLAAVGAL